ncbi:carboxypeptidase regulatory-like domain-containing protein [Amycolatopsis sp. NPDC051373]|uniref:carboxypeptidase regulatory-like domain-containing protein n=1 Tax=Amycolatopsis sp. NPDC051373 TaxID=3155801 RepID=UPI00344D2878
MSFAKAALKILLTFLLAVVAFTVVPALAQAAPAAAVAPVAPVVGRKACPEQPKPGEVTCFALFRGDAHGMQRAAAPQGYGPADLAGAYELPTATGGDGMTVAIVDAYDTPDAEAEMGVYRAQFGLPPCTVANGCFTRVDQRGGQDFPAGNTGWQQETMLDLDMVSAVCPRCHILLVEAGDSLVPNMGAAVNQAVAMGAKFVSNSYGADEDPAELDLDEAYYDHPGVVVTASSGDYGYGPQFPAASPHVTSVGGTSLYRDANARGWRETVWSGTGSGCSAYEPKPPAQTDSGCANRTIADVSAVADLATGVAVFVHGAWGLAGGTSASSPIVAAAYALAGTPAAGTYPNALPYRSGATFNDVTEGANGTCAPAYLCTAGAGFDGPTGLGTPRGISAFTPGATGLVSGTVRDAAGAPLAGAQVKAGDLATTVDAEGHYTLGVPVGTYAVTAGKFSYRDTTVDDVTVEAGKTATANFTLASVPSVQLSGTVRDGSGHGWPVAAHVQVAGQPTTAVQTDPLTGRYSMTVPEDATYSVQVDPDYPGYLPGSASVPVGDTAATHDAVVTVDPVTCGAPGYANRFTGDTQDFEAPSTWQVVNNLGDGAATWAFDNPGGRDNYTGGTGAFATVDSNSIGGDQDTSLVSPVVDLSGTANPTVRFASDYQGTQGQQGAVDFTTDGGATWTTVWQHGSDTVSGPSTQVVPLPGAAGKKTVQVRFNYRDQLFGFWWQVDDVLIGDHACDVVPGGLVTGSVHDHVTGAALGGASVDSVDRPGEGATTQSDGSYWFFSSVTGSHPVTASATNFVPGTQKTVVAPDAVTPADFLLDAGRLEVTSAAVNKTVAWQGKTTANVKVRNTGTAPVDVRLNPSSGAFTPAVAHSAPLQRIKGDFSTGPLLGHVKQAAPAETLAAGDAWQTVADYPTKIMDNGVATVNGKVYSFTGLNGAELTTKNFVYDPGTLAWTPIAELATPRETPAVVAVGTKIYVTGGWADGSIPVTNTDIYDTVTDTWTAGAPMPTATSAMGVAVAGGRIYVVGGCDGGNCGVTRVQVYDPAVDKWSAGPALPAPIGWTNCGTIAGSIYCAGGVSGLDNLKTAYKLDVEKGAWSRVADLPVQMWGSASTVANGQLLLSGGIADGELTNAGYAYDPASNQWSALPNSNETLFRGGSTCGFYRIGGSANASFNPTSHDLLLPGYGECGEYVSIPWLSTTPSVTTIAPGKTATFTVTLDASVAAITQPGTYTAQLVVGAQVPKAVAAIPVSFTVQPPATWSKLTGTVTGARCGATAGPLAAVTVQVDSWAASYTLKTDAAGHYTLWLDRRNNPLTLIAARDGWQPQTRSVKLVKGQAVTADFVLKPAGC